MLKKCKECGEALIDGPSQERSAESERFSVSIKGLPTKICPKGCNGFYWYSPELGTEVLYMLNSESENIALRKGIFKIHQLCRSCRQELETAGNNVFRFEKKCEKGSIIEMTISAPSLYCNRCNLYFLPAQTASWDTYYSELASVISKALSKDLIWK
jgi:hypothetical protein